MRLLILHPQRALQPRPLPIPLAQLAQGAHLAQHLVVHQVQQLVPLLQQLAAVLHPQAAPTAAAPTLAPKPSIKA